MKNEAKKAPVNGARVTVNDKTKTVLVKSAKTGLNLAEFNADFREKLAKHLRTCEVEITQSYNCKFRGAVNERIIRKTYVLDDSDNVSFKQIRKNIQGNILAVIGLKQFNGGRRFKVAAKFEGLEVSPIELFWNSREDIQLKAKRKIKQYLRASFADIAEFSAE